MSYIYLIIAFVCNALANIFLKIGSGQGIVLDTYNPFFLLKENIYIVIGLLLFLINVVVYFIALKNIPISLAYPIMVTMSLIIIGFTAVIFFGEQITYYQIIGYSLIILGVVFVNLKI